MPLDTMMATAKNKLSTDFQSAINCVPERSLLGAFGKQHHDYDHDVFNSAGSTLATPHFGPENGVHLTDPSIRHTTKPGSANSERIDWEFFTRLAYPKNGPLFST